jgi:arylsulfatase A-like enzyme
MHFPTLPHLDFQVRAGNGEFADSMFLMDYRVGQLLDHIKSLGIRDNTVVIFASDDEPDFWPSHRSTARPWSSTYHTAMEGSLEVPFIIRWLGSAPEGVTSNGIVHLTDNFTIDISVAGGAVPPNRLIEDIDPNSFLEHLHHTKAASVGFLFYIKNELRAVKWRDW